MLTTDDSSLLPRSSLSAGSLLPVKAAPPCNVIVCAVVFLACAWLYDPLGN